MINFFFVLGKIEDADKEAIRILKNNQNLFHSNGSWDFLIHFFVDIGWFLTGWLYKFVNFVEDILDKIVTFGGLMNSQEVTNLSMKMMPIAFTLMALIIAILGFSMMMGMKIPISKLAINVILASLFIVSLPGIFQQAFDLNQGLYKDIKSSEFTGKNDLNMNSNKNLKRLSSQIMANNITDLVWYANHHYKPASNDINNEFVDDSFTNGYRRWTEKVKPGDKDDNKNEGFRYYKSITDSKVNTAVFNNSIVQADSDDESYDGFVLKPLSEGIGKSFLKTTTEAFSGYYQRYQANFFAIWFELGVLAFVYVLTAFKIARLGYEVTAQKIVAPWVAATDIATLQKIKQLMINLFTNYGLIALIFILLKVFVILSNTTFKSDIPLSAKLIIFLVLAIGTLDGPDEIKKLLGVDAGIRDGYRTAMAGMAGMAVAGKAGGKVAHATGSGVKGLKNAITSNKRRAESAKNSAKAISGELHDNNMLDSAKPYDKREKQQNKWQRKQDKLNEGDQTPNDKKETKPKKEKIETEKTENGNLKNATNQTNEKGKTKENDSNNNGKDKVEKINTPDNVSIDVANEENKYKYDNDTNDDSVHENYNVEGDNNEISNKDTDNNNDSETPKETPKETTADSLNNNKGTNTNEDTNTLDNDSTKLDNNDKQTIQNENNDETQGKKPFDNTLEQENPKNPNNNLENTITKEIEKGTKNYSHLVNKVIADSNNKSSDLDSFETLKSRGNAQKYRNLKTVNKSLIKYKINKSNQGGKQN